MVSTRADQTIIEIEEDGPGVDPEKTNLLGERGVRLDESVPGTGLGLAIAADITSAYKGNFDLGHSPLGGLKITVSLPSC